MDFLFDNPLGSMYGPYFLVFYSLYIALALVVFAVLKSGLDKTAHFAMPPIPSNPDPFEIAFLRGGENELARSVVFSLTQKNLLKFSSDGKNYHIYATVDGFDRRNLKPIEQTALGWFGTEREAREIFQSRGLAQTLRPFYQTYEARLEQQHFIPGEEIGQKLNRLKKTTALAIAGLGGYKILAALVNGYTNIWGIIILGAIGLIVTAISGKLPRLTKLGKAYLERLQLAFDQLKSPNQLITANQQASPQPTFAAVDPLLLSVGVFGGAVLAGTMYSDYNQAFQRAQASTGSSGSCGSSCGSSSCSSGGDSGGGDGGGGSCGGGCGGCGGGCS